MRMARSIASGLLATLVAGAAHGAVLVNDNFTLSSGSSVSTINNAQSAGVGTYSTVQGLPLTSMTITTLGGFGSGNVLRMANGAQTYYRAFNGASTLTLNSLAVDQTLQLSFNIRFDGTFAGADNFGFGFVNFSSPNSILYANLDLSAVGGVLSEFRYRPASYNMSDNIASVLVGSSFTEPATVDDANYTMMMNATKQADGGFLIQYYRNGNLIGATSQTVASAFVTAMGNTAISGIAFRHANTPSVLTYIDNVSVTTFGGPAVPEPTTAALLLGAAGLLRVAHRRGRRPNVNRP